MVLDIDGTLSPGDDAIAQPVREALEAARRRGVELALATGRRYASALPVQRAIGARAPLISFYGALIKDPTTRRVHRHWPLAQPLAAALLERLGRPRWRDLSVHLHHPEALYVSRIDPLTRAWLAGSPAAATEVGSLRRLAHLAPTKVTVASEDPARIDALAAELQATFGSAEIGFERPFPQCLEAADPRVDKARAVRHLAEDLLGLEPGEVMAIGDSVADASMLGYAGIGIAMGDAPAAVRAAADWVAPTLADDGVAAAIQRWIL